MAPGEGLRWPVAGSSGGDGALFDPADLVHHHVGRGEWAGYEFLEVNAKTVINTLPASSRMPFRHTINAYRGCSHACSYCFARPTHEYLGLDIGDDFERKIVVKVNAVERARVELAAKRWAGHHIAMGTNTDPYQRCEGKYRLTQGVIEALVERANPFSILTKSTLVLRDLDLLVEAAQRCEARVNLSIGTLDEEVWRLTEPGTPAPRLRVEAVRRLNEAGVPCGVLVAPVLPGLSDRPEQLREVVEAVVGAGAVRVSTVMLYLRPGVRELYLGRLAARDPGLAQTLGERYTKAHLPKADEEALSALVREMVAMARRRSPRPAKVTSTTEYVGGSFRDRVRTQIGSMRAVEPAAAAGAPSPGDQLRLDLR